MEMVLEIIICLMAIFGIIFTTASFFQTFRFPNYSNLNIKYKYYDSCKNNNDSKVIMDLYVLESDENKCKKIYNKIINNKDIKLMVSDINIYKTIDKK